MSINLREIIENDSAIKSRGFTGAVFLTYTLNLGFFEQIVAPALERAGCSNVLIIADPDGYAEALELGRNHILHAGRRYVCTPLPRSGYGVQHAKMVLMAGPERGRLLIGSGNLTLHGYSHNLEIYSHFEYDRNDPEPEAQDAFFTAWKLLKNLNEKAGFPQPVSRQIQLISDKADWLEFQPNELEGFSVWHNLESSIWSQFSEWREKVGFGGSPIKTLKVFSPYYDADGSMLCQFTDALLPNQVNLYLSLENSTLNGKELIRHWPGGYNLPEVLEIEENQEDSRHRLLHAKIVVGVEEIGSWCIAGSANMTRAAFAHPWEQGSNLEMVTFRWSPDPTAFDYLLKDQVKLRPLELGRISPASSLNTSEETQKVLANSIVLNQLTLQDGFLSGKLNRWPGHLNHSANLVLLRSGEQLPININLDGSFTIYYSSIPPSSEAGYIEGDGITSLPRWIDFPDKLQEYGARSYQERVHAKLDTVAGAVSLFHELMEFLFDRIHPENEVARPNIKIRRGKRTPGGQPPETGETEKVPEPNHFVIPEKVLKDSFATGSLTQIPYERHIHSVRDLLSIVLLKITTPPETSTETVLEGDDKPEDKQQPTQVDFEEIQHNARLHLCYYLKDYCKKFGQRMCDPDFICEIHPEVLLNNHLTLSRVLLEFKASVDEFTSEDFAKCYWWIWAPLTWPLIVGIESKSSWDLYCENGKRQEFMEAWKQLDLSQVFMALTTSVYGRPPTWSAGLHFPTKVSQFLVLTELVSRFEKIVGSFKADFEFPESIGINAIRWEECIVDFNKIAEFKNPALERLKPLMEWVECEKQGKKPPKDVVDSIERNHLQDELSAYRQRPAAIVGISTERDEGLVYCPKCYTALLVRIVSEIDRGKLTQCNACSMVWLYKEEPLPKQII